MIKTPIEILSEITQNSVDDLQNFCFLVNWLEACEAIEAYYNQDRWISVEDRLPENDTWALIIRKNNDTFFIPQVVKYEDDCFTDFEIEGDFNLELITHWMPLPPNPTT